MLPSSFERQDSLTAMLWFGHDASRYDGSDTLHSADIMQMQKIQKGARAQLHRNVIIEGVAALPHAHKRAQTRQSHESPLLLKPVPPEERSRAAIVCMLIITVLVLGGAMKVHLFPHHSRAAVAMPQVDDSRGLVTLQAFEYQFRGVRIHRSTRACRAEIWHLCV